jgi:hypothetical protein
MAGGAAWNYEAVRRSVLQSFSNADRLLDVARLTDRHERERIDGASATYQLLSSSRGIVSVRMPIMPRGEAQDEPEP